MSQVWTAALLLGPSMTWGAQQPTSACHATNPVGWLHLGDLQDCGPCCTFCRAGQCHRQLLASSPVTTISPRLGRLSVPLRDPLSSTFQPGALDQRTPATQRPHVQTLRVVCCPDQLFGVESLSVPQIVVGFLSRRSVSLLMFSTALARLCDDKVSCSTRWRVAIICCH